MRKITLFCMLCLYSILSTAGTSLDSILDTTSLDSTQTDSTAIYTTQVPSQCTDVMIQSFYWDSNTTLAYGNTLWTTLYAEASELSAYFDLVWLPPSALSTGGVGYHPTQWSNQNSAWGSQTQLTTLISALHAGDAKVIADIVVNHRGNKSTWCDFNADNYGPYGQFQLTAEDICRDDEVNSEASGACKGSATGNYDTGEQYGAARDLDHSSTYVQNDVKAYLHFLKDSIHYDGWRWDVAKGFAPTYFDQYSASSQAYFSVGEYYDGNVTLLKNFIDAAGKNLLLFDFPTKFSALNQGIAQGNYAALQGSGLLGAGYSKNAVTFIDNHDTFERGNGSDFAGISEMSKIIQANVFILCMPGVPCVFYPHWVKYKSLIKPLILARKAAGVNSESTISNETATSNKYEATIQGLNGTLRFTLGPGADLSTPVGYTLAAKGQDYAVFIKTTSTPKPKLSVSPSGGTYLGGTTVTLTALHGGSIYYTLDGTTPSTSSAEYTAPITIAQDTTPTVLKAFATNNGGTTAIQTQTYITYVPEKTEGIKVSFLKPDDWTTVYLWAWDDEGSLFPTTPNAPWPGEAITDQGNGWWSYTFPKTVYSANIIFNNGASSSTLQTADVLNVTESTCYTWGGANEAPIIDPDCGSTGVESTTVEQTLIVYPNPTKSLVFLQSSKLITSVQLYSYEGKKLNTKTVNASYTSLDLSAMQEGFYLLRVHYNDGQETVKKLIKQ